MRTVQTFILRLLVDPAEPDALRGALQLVPEGEAQPFADEQALLHRISAWDLREALGDRAQRVLGPPRFCPLVGSSS